MIREVVDKNSGAILFKKDPDSLRYEELLELAKEQGKRIESLEKALSKTEKRLKALEKA